MLYWSLIFLAVALIAGVVGFGAVPSATSGITRTAFFVFLLLFAITLVSGRGVAA